MPAIPPHMINGRFVPLLSMRGTGVCDQRNQIPKVAGIADRGAYALIGPDRLKCAWTVITAYLKYTVPYDDAVPGAGIIVQTYGDFLNFNPHLHAIVSDGCFLKDGSFQTAAVFMLEDLEEAFQYEVLKMLKKE